MRYWPLLGILGLAVLLQTTVVPYLTPYGLVPDLLLAVVVSYGLLFGWQAGLLAGMGSGLLVDVAIGRYIGISILTLGLAGLLAGLVEQRVFKDNWLLPVIGGLVGSLVKELMTIGVLVAFGWDMPLLSALNDTVLPGALFNALICLVVYLLLLRRYHHFRPDPRGQIFFVRKR